MPKRKIIPYNPKLKELARKLRNNSTKAENVLWLLLKDKQMNDYDFHRQKPINNFILDFFCHELMLGIEVDGYTHRFEDTFVKDELKEKKMEALGITILRFSDNDVLTNADNVLMAIEQYIRNYECTHPLR